MSKEWDPGEEYIEGGANPSKLCLPQIFTKSSYIVKLNLAKDQQPFWWTVSGCEPPGGQRIMEELPRTHPLHYAEAEK